MSRLRRNRSDNAARYTIHKLVAALLKSAKCHSVSASTKKLLQSGRHFNTCHVSFHAKRIAPEMCGLNFILNGIFLSGG